MVTYAVVGLFIKKDEEEKERASMMMYIDTIKEVNKEKSKAQLELERAKSVLKELDFPSDPVDILKLLEDREKMDVILRKLKMKAFW